MPTDSPIARVKLPNRDIDEAAVIQQAVESGVETLWRDVVIAKYLDGDLTRDAGPQIHLTQADGLHLLVAFDEVSIPQSLITHQVWLYHGRD